MEAQRFPCPPVSLEESSVQLSCLQTIPAASDLLLSPMILQPEQALTQTVYLKALTVPFYQPIQSNHKLSRIQTNISIDNSNIPLILNPLLHSEGTDQLQAIIQKQPSTINIVSNFSVLPQSSSPCAPVGSPGKSKNTGKYLCKHCGRDCMKPSVLEKHMRSHTGERPFPCTTCGIAFKTQSNLYKHRRTQTHVNNARVPSESDSSSVLEEREKVTEKVAPSQTIKSSDKNGVHPSARMLLHAASEPSVVVTGNKHILASSLSEALLVSESQRMKMGNSCDGEINQNVFEKETTKDPTDVSQRRKIQDQRSPTGSKHSQLQRQQALYSDKLWNSRPVDIKLKKCESTDSGYLSRSDSVEHQTPSPGFLHSLCEHSTESEDDAAITNKRISDSFSKVDSTEKATGTITLEKKRLEEHISRLISHNKTVVDDTQLDSVRPRKTVLSKQGSIDLPMPYMYKDSFHFDIRPLDISKKKNLPLHSAKSIFTPGEKSKPLFFHSVPTQFSTTIDCVPVTRSNSLPFIESTKKMQDQTDSTKFSPFMRVSPEVGFLGLLHSSNLTTSITNVLNSHPRALVRQVAVDDVPLNNMNESFPSLGEKRDKKKSEAEVEGVNKNKKPSQRKLKMFSQEKWQVYGAETFKKIYQKMKSNQSTKKQKGNKLKNVSNVCSDIKETARNKEITLPTDGRSSITEDVISSPVDTIAKPNADVLENHSTASPVSCPAFSQGNSGRLAELIEPFCPVGDCEQSSVGSETSSLEHRCRDWYVSKHNLSGNSKALPLSSGCELKVQLKQTLLNVASQHDHDLEDGHEQKKLTECVQKQEDIEANRKGCSRKETFHLGHAALSAPQGNTGELVYKSQQLPSERKKPKVDKLKNMENIILKNSSSTESVVKQIDCYGLNIVTPESVKCSDKGEKWTVMVGTHASGSSMECEEGIQHSTTVSNNRDCIVSLTDTASISAPSFPEQFKTYVTEKCTNNLFAIKKLTKKSSPITTGTGESSNHRDIAAASTTTQHVACNQVIPLKKNDFLPKYILKYSQEGNNIGMPLFLTGEPENIPCVSLPSMSTISPYPACNNKLLDGNSVDVSLCPLQLDLSNPVRRKELKRDVHKKWTSLVASSPAILEATAITTMVDRKCHLQSASKKVKDTCKEDNRDSLDDQRLITKKDEYAVACTSHTPGRKVCFTTIYKGGLFISSDMIGQNSALKLIQSGKSSVISLSSLVERAVLCESSEEEVKEWQSKMNSFPGFEDLPSCSVGSPKCLCHSSSMLYCHVLCTQPKESCSWPQLSVESQAGKLKIPSLNLSFPTLNAEPQLTWCCLSRSLPLPIEQKEMKDSAYSSLYMNKNENFISKCGLSICKTKSHGKAASKGWRIEGPQTLVSSPQRQRIEKKYFLNTGIQEICKNIPELEKKKEKLYKRRENRNIKRIKVKINPNRQKDHLKSHMSSKQRWALRTPRKCSRINTSGNWEHCRKCHCFPTTSGNNPNLQGPFYRTMDKAAFTLEEGEVKQETPGSNERSSDSLFLQRISTIQEVPTYSCLLSNNASAQIPNSLDSCSLGIFPKEQWPDVDSDYYGPSIEPCNLEFKDTKKSQPCNFVRSQITRPIFVSSKSGCCNIELKDKNVITPESPIPIVGRKEQVTNGALCPSLKEQFAPTCQSPCPVLLTSRLLTEAAVSNKSLPGTPPKENQSLEATNKQTHLEYDDISSSEDEDRLVIEI